MSNYYQKQIHEAQQIKNRYSFHRFPAIGVMRVFAALVGLLWFGGLVIRADTHYVSLDGGNISPFTNGWASAATEIQWAVYAATAGDTVLVSNGTYNLTNQINILTNITVRSFTEEGHGTNDTIINGNYPAYTNRCVYMTKGAVLAGFTISNGYHAGTAGETGGGGVYISSSTSLMYNCFVYKNCCSNTGNYAGGGGIYFYYGGTVSNCAIVSNTAYLSANNAGGGGAYLRSGGRLVASRISGNVVQQKGGGVYTTVGGTVTNCILDNNQASSIYGGGVHQDGGDVENCIVSNNTPSSGGGAVYSVQGKTKDSTIVGNSGGYAVITEYNAMVSNCQVIANTGGGIYISKANGSADIVNCVIARNAALGLKVAGVNDTKSVLVKNCLICCNTNSGGGAGVYLDGNIGQSPRGLINCTIVSNQSGTLGGGIRAASTTNYIVNCIVYSNVSINDDYDEIYNSMAANTNNYWYTCIRPTPLAPDTTLAPNQGNITNNPVFIDFNAGNYRLIANSPCINTGTNGSWTTNSYDLDGRTRIRYGTVDMGAYEIIYDGTVYKLY